MPVQLSTEIANVLNGVIEDRLIRRHKSHEIPVSAWNRAFLTPDQERYVAAKLYSGRCKALAALDEASTELDNFPNSTSVDERERIWDNYQAASKLATFLSELAGAL